jgi:hypothetical protein
MTTWPRLVNGTGTHGDVGLLSNNLPYWWLVYTKVAFSLALSLFGGYGLIGLMRDRCKKSEVVWKLTLIVFSAPVLVFVFFSLCAQLRFCERFIADTVSFGSVAGMLLKLVTKPRGDKVIKLIVQQINGEKQDVWLNSSALSVAEVRNRIAETMEITPNSRVRIESGKGKAIEDLNMKFFDLIDDAHKSTDFFGFCTASCYISVEEPVAEEVAPNIEWKVKEGDKKFNPFKALLDSRAKFGDPLLMIARSALSDDAKKFHIAAVDRFAGAAPGNAPLFAQLKIYAWSSHGSDGDGEDTKTGAPSDWESNSEMASSVQTSGSRKSRSLVGMLFHRKTSDESKLRGKAIQHGDAVVIEADGRWDSSLMFLYWLDWCDDAVCCIAIVCRFLSVTRGWWLAWSSSEPRYSGAFEIEIVERAPQNQKMLREHIANLRRIGQLGNLNLHLPGHKHISPKNAAAPVPTVAEAEKVVEQDPSLRPGDMFRLKSVKFPGYELGITSVKLSGDYYYLGLRKVSVCIHSLRVAVVRRTSLICVN